MRAPCASPRPTGSARRSDCPLSLALELVGDAWTLLIVRDLMFKGKTSFRELMLWSAAYETTAAPAEALALVKTDRDAFLRVAVTAADLKES